MDVVVDILVDVVVDAVAVVVVDAVVDAVVLVVSFVVSKYFQRFKTGKTVTTLAANLSSVEVVVNAVDSVVSELVFRLLTTSAEAVALSSADLSEVARVEEEALVGRTSSRGMGDKPVLNLDLPLNIQSELVPFTGLFFWVIGSRSSTLSCIFGVQVTRPCFLGWTVLYLMMFVWDDARL